MKDFFNNVYKVLIEKRTDFSGRASRSEYWSYDHGVYIFFHLQNIPQLLLGTDCADPMGQGDKCSGSQQIGNVRRLLVDEKARAKIFSGNAKKIIRM